MKKLLFAVLVLTSFAVVTEVVAADKKPQAQTKASPKAGDKAKAKAAPKAAAKAEPFKPHDAGEWLPVDNKKGHLLGYPLCDGDLKHQPVLIVKFDPDEEINGEKRETDPKLIYQFLGWEVKVQPHLQVVNVPSRPIEKDELPLLGKIAGKTAAVPGFPWYQNFGLENEPANTANVYPFYYVVDTDGKVIYAGNKGKIAQSHVYGALKKSGTPDPMLGFVKPAIHSNICASLVFGVNSATVVQKLKPLVLKGTPESKAEAQAILDALDQSQTYWLKQVRGLMGSNPPQAFLLATQVLKTFPRNKEFKPIVDRLKKDAANALKPYLAIADIEAKLKECEEKGEEPKKADLKKWYLIVCNAEKKVNAAKKSFGDNLPRSFLCLDDIVQTVKAELETRGAEAK